MDGGGEYLSAKKLDHIGGRGKGHETKEKMSMKSTNVKNGPYQYSFVPVHHEAQSGELARTVADDSFLKLVESILRQRQQDAQRHRVNKRFQKTNGVKQEFTMASRRHPALEGGHIFSRSFLPLAPISQKKIF